jgi:Na+(H+)/acetate symporter ActP
MTPASLRLLGNVILGVAILLLLVTLGGMVGLIPKLAASRELIIVAFILTLVARGLRRRGPGTPA